MERKNIPSGKKLRMVNFNETFDASTRDNEKWKATRSGKRAGKTVIGR